MDQAIHPASKSRRGPGRLFGTVSGYFTNRERVTAALGRLDGRDAQAVYCTLNPCQPELRARADNRLVNRADATTQDREIVKRTRLLIDTDPERATGISATDEEQAAGLAVRDGIREYLTDYMWPEPLIVSASGSGGGLVYGIDLPNDEASTELVRACLEALAGLFETEAVKLDKTVYNAARLTKVVGTVAARGDHCPDIGRTWRLATGKFNPDAAVVRRELLEALAVLAPTFTSAGTAVSRGATGPIVKHARGERSWTIADVLRRSGIGFYEKAGTYGTAYVLERCLTSDAHIDGAAIVELSSGALDYRCCHNSCGGKGWHDVKRVLGLESAPYVSQGSSNGTVVEIPPPTDRPEPAWPDPLKPEAFTGLLGEIVRAIEPYSEADPAALLAHTIPGTGVLIGPNVYAIAGDARHPPRFFTIVVGETAKGRKGSAARPNERLLVRTDDIGRSCPDFNDTVTDILRTLPNRTVQNFRGCIGRSSYRRSCWVSWPASEPAHPAQVALSALDTHGGTPQGSSSGRTGRGGPPGASGVIANDLALDLVRFAELFARGLS